jgi:DNA-binding MarR family transcriptional regulator
MDNTPRKTLSLSGMFYRRKDDWIRHILKLPKSELSHVEKLVAIYIAETINPEVREWVTSQGRIADDMEIGIRIVKSAVGKLKKAGLLSVRRTRLMGKQKRFNSYAIVAVEDAIPEDKVHGRAPT